MQSISCFVNFNEKLNKNVPYYTLMMHQINGFEQDIPSSDLWIGENAVLCASSSSQIVSTVCEGYQFTIAFCGEIHCKPQLIEELSSFGYHFLTEKDAETVLYSYIHFGEKCSGRLMGDFSFIIYDAMRRQVFSLCSSHRSTPVFYAKTGAGCIISSSLRGILAHPDTPKRLSDRNLLEFLSAQNRIPINIFEDVHILEHTSFLKISRDKITTADCVPPQSVQGSTDTFTEHMGIILSGTPLDRSPLENLSKTLINPHKYINVYGEKCPDSPNQQPIKFHGLSMDNGTVLYGIESCISACGFPVLSDYDYLLPIALHKAKGCDEALFFTAPDRFSPPKSYLFTLLKNCAFHPAVEKNICDFSPKATILAPYPQLIAEGFDAALKTSSLCDNEETTFTKTCSTAVKTALRHILLDIISKEHSPIIAFFKRSGLLRLCEGGFVFSAGESEWELIAYLIKLNMWFEKYHPHII